MPFIVMNPIDATCFVPLVEGAVAEGDSLVTVVVGEDQKKYRISKKQLVKGSDYFKAALSGPWIESESQEVVLADEDPLSFELAIQWIYINMAFLRPPTTPPLALSPQEAEKAKKAYDEATAVQVTSYLQFLKLADYLQLHGDLVNLVSKYIEELFTIGNGDDGWKSVNGSLSSLHFAIAKNLPRNKPIFSVFARLCVRNYLWAKGANPGPFKFEAELEEIDVFGAELLKLIPLKYMFTNISSKQRAGLMNHMDWVAVGRPA